MNWASAIKSLGPGLLYAGAAVGVSHLVQSTRAGAQFGYGLLWVIVLAHLVKYPFFLMGPKYAQATGRSILSGYKEIGNWALWAFLALTAASMFAVIAAISVVSSGLAENLFQLQINIKVWSSILVGVCLLILILGRYKVLDRLISYVIVILSITTVLAFLSSYGIQLENTSEVSFDWNDELSILFLIAFIGWMPAPMDISIWHSVWQVKKVENQPELKSSNSSFDFNVGYMGTGLLAILFLGLGANVFYGSSTELAQGGIQFSAQLIDIYSSSIGQWSYWIIAIAAFTTMFSTIITCIDAFPRVMSEASLLIANKRNDDRNRTYLIYLILLAVGSQIIVYVYLDNMKQIVDFATSVSFLTTPLLAVLSYLSIQRAKAENKLQFPKSLIRWSQISLLLLFAFALYYLSVLL